MLSKFPSKRYLLELWNEGSVTPGNCHQNSPTTRIKYRLNEAYEHGSGCYPNYFKACLFWSVTLYCHETLKPAWRQKKQHFGTGSYLGDFDKRAPSFRGLNGHQISKHFYSPVFRISSAPASVVDSVVAFEDTFLELLSAGGLGVGKVIGTSADSIRLITRLLTESLSRRYIFSC